MSADLPLEQKRLVTCVKCPHRKGNFCGVSGRRIFDHAKEDACPDTPSRYTDAPIKISVSKNTQERVDAANLSHQLNGVEEHLIGDIVEEIFRGLGIERAAKAWAQFTKKPCKCKNRKEWLNKVHRGAKDVVARWFGNS